MSSERSGSNLLRTLLANHSQVCGPKAPHLLKTFAELIPYYEDLSRKENGRVLFDDMLRVVNHPLHDWEFEGRFDALYERYQPASFLDYFNLMYAEHARRADARHIVCKENEIFNYAIPLARYFGDERFTYLYRDPRDCVASWMNVPLGFQNPPSAARNWENEQQTCTRLRFTYRFPTTTVQYESLIQDPRSVMTRTLNALGLKPEPACFSTQGVPDELDEDRPTTEEEWNEYWKNLDRPIMSSNSKKYRNEFDFETLRQIETITKESLVRLGYTLDTLADWEGGQPRGFLERAGGVMRRAWKHLAPNVLTETASTDSSDEIDDEKTTEILASRMELAKKLNTKRREEWRRRHIPASRS